MGIMQTSCWELGEFIKKIFKEHEEMTLKELDEILKENSKGKEQEKETGTKEEIRVLGKIKKNKI